MGTRQAPSPGTRQRPGSDTSESSAASLSRFWLPLFLLSAATLAFEINLTRLFSVAQFYHFAFMIVSIALLGFGASGTALAIFPALRHADPSRRLTELCLAAAVSMLAAYLLTNWLPFDSFSIAWDIRQVWILLLHYIALAAPFFFSGMAVGFLLSGAPRSAGTTYAANLFGSAAGCLIALAAPPFVGAEGMVTLSVSLAAAAGAVASVPSGGLRQPATAATLALLVFATADLGLRLALGHSVAFLNLRLSPYKGLSYAMQYPGSRLIRSQWNAFSRVDVLRSGGIHSVPGLSYRYLQPLPVLDGMLVDADDLNPIVGSSVETAFTTYLPGSAAFYLRPSADTLVLEPRGGLDLLTALALTSGTVTAVEANPLIINDAPIYSDSRLQVFVQSDRSYIQSATARYDVIVLSLSSSFHAIRSGAYTLTEDYRYTVEAFEQALSRLKPEGLIIATRWLQDPPSEDLRLFALSIEALQNSGGSPGAQLVAFRGFNTATVLLKNGAFSPDELSSLRTFLDSRAFDVTYAPDVHPDETNRYNILPRSLYYETYGELLNAASPEQFYAAYAYDVRPPTDDRPFFAHYFKWSQAHQVLAELGTAWLPFGGAGYFVILALLALAVVLAASIILLPLAVGGHNGRPPGAHTLAAALIYFGLLGLAFLFVELPLLQRFILYLDQPAYAVALVLFSLLLFSGIGSRLSPHISVRRSLAALVILIIGMPAALERLFDLTLGMPLAVRFGMTALSLAPLGFLMGIPFPSGIQLIASQRIADGGSEAPYGSVPWAWAVNGAASVVASILAALLALTYGFSWVLRLGAACYALAALTAWAWLGRSRPGSPPR